MGLPNTTESLGEGGRGGGGGHSEPANLSLPEALLYAQTLDAKGEIHATGPLKLSKCKTVGLTS